jgi:hypothetical protein
MNVIHQEQGNNGNDQCDELYKPSVVNCDGNQVIDNSWKLLTIMAVK